MQSWIKLKDSYLDMSRVWRVYHWSETDVDLYVLGEPELYSLKGDDALAVLRYLETKTKETEDEANQKS